MGVEILCVFSRNERSPILVYMTVKNNSHIVLKRNPRIEWCSYRIRNVWVLPQKSHGVFILYERTIESVFVNEEFHL